MSVLETVLDVSRLGSGYDTQFLGSLGEFLEWGARTPAFFSVQSCKAIADHAMRHGIASAFLGAVGPDEMTCASANYREDLLARQLNARQRAVLDVIAVLPAAAEPAGMRIYAPEAITPFAMMLRGRFPKFIGSEYAPSRKEADELLPILHQDLLKLTYPDGLFDLVVSNEVFEHVPDLGRTFSEIHRTLRTGGVMLATFPFLPAREASLVKARLVKGRVQHLEQPEYHGNPQRPAEGSLVYQVPGWDVIGLADSVGFDARMLVVSSLKAGITGGDGAGIFVFAAVKR